ncbi:hypothetical protein [Paenibacillus sp. UNC496MF]|uniref:hypothetical protein n=1 Tax=Paenibacillus sp. UNC496MF TaxID=1502753 RepID=UPI001C42EBD7|nr:hypothetical protein [Paenibacillus sp. UNC496MF]
MQKEAWESWGSKTMAAAGKFAAESSLDAMWVRVRHLDSHRRRENHRYYGR